MFSKSIALFLLLTSTLFAQDRAPVLIAEMDGNQVPMMLIKVDTKVRIAGRLAETTLTMSFLNENNRQLSGTLYFPLPEEATVSGYALDINGKMIDGVIVSKAQGRRIFEKIVRQRTDPGLIEWARGNTFKTRVFPIPPQGRRIIKVVYVSQLNTVNNTFTLPMNYKEPINNFKLDISVLDPEAKPSLKSGESEFKKEGGIWKTSISHKNKVHTEDIIVEIPELNQRKTFVEKASDGNYYYVIYDTPEVQKAQAAKIESLSIAWDFSLSRKGKHEKEIELLRTYLNSLPAATKVNLIAFSNTAEALGSFTASQVDEIIKTIQAQKYDGGTHFKSLDNVINSASKTDLILLFSDGIANWGERELNTKTPVYTFSADSSTEASFLKFLALSSGGQWFNLKSLPVSKVASAIGKNTFLFQGTEGGIANTSYPRIPTPVNGTVTVVGKLDGKRNKIKLQYGLQGGPRIGTDYIIDTENAFVSDLLRRYWAQNKLSNLLIDQEENKNEIEALGKKHKLVTPYTSLIVLESIDQYIEHQVKPPESMPEWVKAYDKWLSELAQNDEARIKQQTKNLSNYWDSRLKHYETKFTYPENFKYKAKGKKKGEEGLDDPFAEPAQQSVNQSLSDAAPASDAQTILPGDQPEMIETKTAEGLSEGIVAFDSLAANETVAFEDAGVDSLVGGIGDVAGGEDAFGGGAGAHLKDAVSIEIKKWDPKTPYITAIKKADDKYQEYIEQRKKYQSSPAFYFDCAAYFYNSKNNALGEKVLSNIVELNLENAALLRIIAYRLLEEKSFDLAIKILRDVIKIREEEPQSYRDLALALSAKADSLLKSNLKKDAEASYKEALKNLEHVITNNWDRFEEIEIIALNEYNRICAKSGLPHFDKSLNKVLNDDIRIVLSWDVDQTDIDLWVTEPSGEKVYYSHNRSTIGGRVSRDFTNGYGPEEYTVRKAMKGKYKIQANFYGSAQVGVSGAVTLKVDVFTKFGTPEEKHQVFSVKLKDNKEVIDLGEIEF